MTPPEAWFSQTYAEARTAFLAAATAAGLPSDALVHPLTGRDREALAIDVVRDGRADAEHLLLLSSGCHGVEGFCGSAVQTMLLHDAEFRAHCADRGVAVLYVHALNPYGFSWWRRTTDDNVDLNRNFHDFEQPLPANPGYDELAPLLVPAAWPPGEEVQAALQAWTDRHGMPTFQAAVSGGQHRHPDGLFYGGTAPTWSHLQLRQILRHQARLCRRLAWIDVHTGLGPSGVGERIFAWRHDAIALARARHWWGPAITSVDDGSSSSARLTGLMWNVVDQECPQAEYTGIALEFGTLPLVQMFDALRADQWAQNHPEAPESQRAAIKRQLRDAFYVDTAEWKAQVLGQAAEAARQAVMGLTSG